MADNGHDEATNRRGDGSVEGSGPDTRREPAFEGSAAEATETEIGASSVPEPVAGAFTGEPMDRTDSGTFTRDVGGTDATTELPAAAEPDTPTASVAGEQRDHGSAFVTSADVEEMAGEPDTQPRVERPRKRWPRVAAVVVIVALAAAAGALGWLATENADRADGWETVAVDTQAVLDDTEAELESTETDLADAQAEIGDLQDRVADLAAEKSQIATEREFFQTQHELVTGLALIGDDAIASMGQCLSAQGDVTLAVFDLDPGSYLFYTYLDIYQDVSAHANDVCSSAIADVNSFRGLLDQLLAQI